MKINFFYFMWIYMMYITDIDIIFKVKAQQIWLNGFSIIMSGEKLKNTPTSKNYQKLNFLNK